MRKVYPCLLLSLTSILAFSQAATSGSPGSAAEAVVQEVAQEQPFLHGHEASGVPAARTREVVHPEDLRGELESLKSQVGAGRALIEIPPNAPAGWWRGTADSRFRFMDDRGNTLPFTDGRNFSGFRNGYKTGLHNGILFRAAETDQSSPETYTAFVNTQFHYEAARGGVNNFTAKGGAKTDYFNLLATSEMRTIGQKSGIASYLSSFSNGDTLGIQSYITQFGGYDTAGDEQTEGVRIQIQQGSSPAPSTGAIFQGVVKSVQGKVLAYTATRDEDTLGEHRMIRDLDRGYSAGSIVTIQNSGGGPNTVHITGSGTHWLEMGKGEHTSWIDLSSGGGVLNATLAFCFDPLKADGYDACFPVSEVVDDTHLTLNLLNNGPQQNTIWPSSWPTSGSYHLYASAWPTSVDLEGHTFTAPELSQFAAGHRIDQVLAYNMQVFGILVGMSRHIGIPSRGQGMRIVNMGTAQSPRMDSGMDVSGGFDAALTMQESNTPSGIPNYFATLYTDPGSKVLFNSTQAHSTAREVGLWRLRDTAGSAHVLLSFLRDSSTACVLDAALCVAADGTTETEKLGQKEADDYAGTIAMDGTRSARVNFKRPFQSTPICTLTPDSDPTAAGSYWVTTSRSSVVANAKQASSIIFNYICVGNPN